MLDGGRSLQSLVVQIMKNNVDNRQIDVTLNFITNLKNLFDFALLLLIKCITFHKRCPRLDLDSLDIKSIEHIKDRLSYANIIFNYKIDSPNNAPDVVKKNRIVHKIEGVPKSLSDYSLHLLSKQYYVIWFDLKYKNWNLSAKQQIQQLK